MFQTYLIGLREGLEAALVVGILVAYLRKTDRGRFLRYVVLGVGAAIALSLAVRGVLTFTSRELSFKAQEAFGGAMSIVAVAFVTWMVFWMRATSHHLKADLHRSIDHALSMGPLALVAASFISVGREGLETALFLWPLAQPSSGGNPRVFLGAVAGLVTAVAIGYLIYRRAIAINLARFFRITGILLVVVAAGVLAYGIHDLQEADILPGLNSLAWDVSEHIAPSSWYGTLLKGTINFSPQTTWLEFFTWVVYVVPVMFLFLRPQRSAAAPKPALA